MFKGGVFGFGGVGQAMTRQTNLNGWYGDDMRIVAVCNRGKPKRDIAEKEYGLAAYDNIDDLIAHGLDFMLIVSTSAAHHDAAITCANAGIPFLIEKPLALTVEDAREIVAATEAAGVINGVNYSMRYSPVYVKMKQMLDEGMFGDVLALWARTCRGHGLYMNGARHRAIVEPEESGGWIVHHMCHIVDWAIWMAGEVDEVYTLTRSTAPAELDSEEIIFSTVKFTNGAIGTVTDQIGSLRDHSAGVIGTKGGAAEAFTGVKPIIKYNLETDIEFRPSHVADPAEGVDTDEGLPHFLKCLRAGKPTSVPVGEACYSLEVCHAMRISAHEGRPVKMSEV